MEGEPQPTAPRRTGLDAVSAAVGYDVAGTVFYRPPRYGRHDVFEWHLRQRTNKLVENEQSRHRGVLAAGARLPEGSGAHAAAVASVPAHQLRHRAQLADIAVGFLDARLTHYRQHAHVPQYDQALVRRHATAVAALALHTSADLAYQAAVGHAVGDWAEGALRKLDFTIPEGHDAAPVLRALLERAKRAPGPRAAAEFSEEFSALGATYLVAARRSGGLIRIDGQDGVPEHTRRTRQALDAAGKRLGEIERRLPGSTAALSGMRLDAPQEGPQRPAPGAMRRAREAVTRRLRARRSLGNDE